MPRDGTGVYTYPAGTPGVPDTTIESEKYNAYINDAQNDANNPRPIIAGGTGASTAADARANLGAMPLTGGTMTGNITIVPPSGSASVTLIKPASGQSAYIASYTAANLRWQMHLGEGTAETGGNAGSEFVLNRYSDAGTVLGSALIIYRATGAVTLNGATTVNGAASITGTFGANGVASFGSTGSFAGNLTVNGDHLNLQRAGLPTQGLIYFGPTAQTKYLHWTGTNFSFVGGPIVASAQSIQAGTSLHAGTSIHAGTSLHVGTTSAFGGQTTHSGGAIVHSSLGNINSASLAPFYINGGYPALSFYWAGVFHSNITMNTDGNFYMGGGSHGGNYYKFWTTRDFSSISTAYVTSCYWLHAGDSTFQAFVDGGTHRETYGAHAFVAGMWSGGSAGHGARYRHLYTSINGAGYVVGAIS